MPGLDLQPGRGASGSWNGQERIWNPGTGALWTDVYAGPGYQVGR